VEALSRKAGEVFHFVAHHAMNEDRYLLPAMEAKGMPQAEVMRSDHASLDAELDALRRDASGLSRAPDRLHRFYLFLARFVCDYLAHLHVEEAEILPVIHAR
jgi:hemerythrin-like domain-containing protein